MNTIFVLFFATAVLHSNALATGQSNGTEEDVKLMYTRHPSEIVVHTEGSQDIVIKLNGTPQGITYDLASEKIYWALRAGEFHQDAGIQRANLNSGEHIETIILNSEGLNILTGIAVDWITHNIYYADGRQTCIAVCDNSGANCAVLYHDPDNQPFRIALCPNSGYMFWSSISREPWIYKSGMDGSSPTPIVSQGLTLPGSIVVDHEQHRIYWNDQETGFVESTDMDGHDRRLFKSQGKVVTPIWHFTMSSKSIFWVDAEEKTIKKCSKDNCSDISTIVKLPNIHIFCDMTTIYPGGQPIRRANPCEDAPCRYICVLTPESYKCLCPQGLTMSADGQTCQDLGTRAVITTENGTEILSLATMKSIQIPSEFPARALSYNFKRDKIYWTSGSDSTHFIYRANINGSGVQAMVKFRGPNPITGIAVDWITGNIYYANTIHIGVCNHKGKNCVVLIEEPHDPPYRIALDPEIGQMYWTVQGLVPSIKRAGMDGSSSARIVRGTAMLSSVVIDQQESRLYWLDRSDNIETSDLEWRTRRTIRPLRVKVGSIAIKKDRLYWIDLSGQVIQSCDKRTQMDPKTFNLAHRNRTVFDMIIFHSYSQPDDRVNHCKGGLCSHICVLTLKYFRCLCPKGMVLGPDQRTCNVCTNMSACSFPKQTRLCPAGPSKSASESPTTSTNCPEFTCKDGRCLNQSKVCDGVCDCPGADGSDEGPGCEVPCAGLECSYKCLVSSRGPYCICEPGFEIGNDSVTCQDIDECQKPVCKNFCVNLEGSYMCQDFQVESGFTRKSLVAISAALTVFATAVVSVASYVGYKYKQAKAILRNLTPEEIEEFLQGNEAVATRLSDGAEKAVLLPFKHVLDPDKILIANDSVLGSGNFAVVYRGFYGLEAVAVKKFKRTVEIDEFKAVLAEAKIMAFIGNHEHVVRFIGADVSRILERKIVLVTELSTYGDLRSFLRKAESAFARKISSFSTDASSPYVQFEMEDAAKDDDEDEYIPAGLCTKDLMIWCMQIAKAMAYLESKKIIHGDLAARNVLVFKDLAVKITDFGLSKQLYTNSEYISKGIRMLPWRWAAPEVLTRLEFSSECDIWAFGVTIWEIMTLGREPYEEFFAYGQPFLKHIQDGHRLEKPQLTDDITYQILEETWSADRYSRPRFSTLQDFFHIQAEAISNTATLSA